MQTRSKGPDVAAAAPMRGGRQNRSETRDRAVAPTEGDPQDGRQFSKRRSVKSEGKRIG